MRRNAEVTSWKLDDGPRSASFLDLVLGGLDSDCMFSFTLALILLMFTPGPAVLTAAGFGASYGFRRSVGFVIGLLIGANLVCLAIVSGFAAVLFSVPWLRLVLVAASFGFLLFLASKIALAGVKLAFISSSRPPGIIGGILIQTVNPKAYAVMTSMVTGFSYAPDNLGFELTTKILIANVIWLPMHLMWLWAGVRLHALNLSDRTQRWINVTMAGGLVLVVLLSASSFLTAEQA